MKRLLLLIAMCLFLLPLSAQRYLPGQQGLQAIGGTTDGYGLIRHRNVGFYIGIARSSYTFSANRCGIPEQALLLQTYPAARCPIYSRRRLLLPVPFQSGQGRVFQRWRSAYDRLRDIQLGAEAAHGRGNLAE